MKQFEHSRRLSRVGMATALFVVVSFNSLPSIPSVPDARPPAPNLDEVLVLDELVEWVLGAPLEGSFHVFDSEVVSSAVRSRARSFDLFRRYHGSDEARRITDRLPFGHLISQAAERYRVDGLLLAAIVEAESGFDPLAVSPQGAMGLMQVMPETAGLTTELDLLEPRDNIEIGARYFSSLLRRFDGDVALALAGYNAGPGSVDRFGGIPPYRETTKYVDRVLSRYVDHHKAIWRDADDSSFLLFL